MSDDDTESVPTCEVCGGELFTYHGAWRHRGGGRDHTAAPMTRKGDGLHPWAAFCEAAMVSLDTQRSYADLAERYERYTGAPIAWSEVEALGASWREHCRQNPGRTIGTFNLKAVSDDH